MTLEDANPATTADVSAVGEKVDRLRRAFEEVFAKPPEVDRKTESDLGILQSGLDEARSALHRFEKSCGLLDARLRRQARCSQAEITGLQFEIATLRAELTVRAALLREKHSAWEHRIAGVRQRIERAGKEISRLERARTERGDNRRFWVFRGLWWLFILTVALTSFRADRG